MPLFNLPFLCAVVLGVVFNLPLSYRCHTAQWCEGGPPSQETYWPQPYQPQQQEVTVAHPSATMQTNFLTLIFVFLLSRRKAATGVVFGDS